MRTVKAIIEADGSVRVEYNGFTGKTCLQEAKKIYEKLKALGVDVNITKTVEQETTQTSTKVSTNA